MEINYSLWSTKAEYTGFEAAFLFCELEPVSESQIRKIAAPPPDKIPQSVLSIARELERDKVPYEPLFRGRNAQEGRLYKRDDLIEWANERGYRPKFLFTDPEPAVLEQPMRNRERENLQRTIGALAVLLAQEAGGHTYGPPHKPNATKIATQVRRIVVEILKEKADGQTPKSLAEKINKCVKEYLRNPETPFK